MLRTPSSPARDNKFACCAVGASKPRVTLRQRMPAEKLRKGVYLIPSLFTAGNLMCGFFSIIATFHGEYVNAALLILLANVFDGVDGYVARLTRTTSQFGVEFDSLADVCRFRRRAGGFGLYLGAVAVAELGLVGGLRLMWFAARAVIALQCPSAGSGEESFRRSADSGGGANDYVHR